MNREIVAILGDSPGELFIDCTVGMGGHSYYLLKNFDHIRIIAVDIDEDSLQKARISLAEFQDRVEFHRCNFIDVFEQTDLRKEGKTTAGLLIDPGISMVQLKDPGRGFSHNIDSPLDMRKDKKEERNASQVINTFSEHRLTEIFENYGDVERAAPLSKKIIERRLFGPIDTTFQLKEVIEKIYGKKQKKGETHPAARVFQALRIFVNRELEGVEAFLEKLPQHLGRGAKIIFLSYHSIEDRMVKRVFNRLKKELKARIIKPFPTFPKEDEIRMNPPSRSAKLRAVEVL